MQSAFPADMSRALRHLEDRVNTVMDLVNESDLITKTSYVFRDSALAVDSCPSQGICACVRRGLHVGHHARLSAESGGFHVSFGKARKLRLSVSKSGRCQCVYVSHDALEHISMAGWCRLACRMLPNVSR